MGKAMTRAAARRRAQWVERIRSAARDFRSGAADVQAALADEIRRAGRVRVVEHLRFCPAVPESFPPDSTEEKLYAKYTDAVIAESYATIGATAVVLAGRGDSADVEAVAPGYDFVADAKAFRLSRTAKNQKDFKIAALANWKQGRRFAMVVCPLYQLPARASQIYRDAAVHSVCVFSYSHLAVLVRLADSEGAAAASSLLHQVFSAAEALHPAKDAGAYWQAINRTMLAHGPPLGDLWQAEKVATFEALEIERKAALAHYAAIRASIMRMTRAEAVAQLIRMHRLDRRIEAIRAVSDNSLMSQF